MQVYVRSLAQAGREFALFVAAAWWMLGPLRCPRCKSTFHAAKVCRCGLSARVEW